MIKNKNRGEFIDRQRKGVGAGEEENIYFSFSLARSPIFSERTKIKIKRLCTGYFHTVKRMSAPDEAQKILCIVASLEFFSCVSTRRLLFHHDCPVRSQRLCVKGRFLCSTFLTEKFKVAEHSFAGGQR